MNLDCRYSLPNVWNPALLAPKVLLVDQLRVVRTSSLHQAVLGRTSLPKLYAVAGVPGLAIIEGLLVLVEAKRVLVGRKSLSPLLPIWKFSHWTPHTFRSGDPGREEK